MREVRNPHGSCWKTTPKPADPQGTSNLRRFSYLQNQGLQTGGGDPPSARVTVENVPNNRIPARSKRTVLFIWCLLSCSAATTWRDHNLRLELRKKCSKTERFLIRER